MEEPHYDKTSEHKVKIEHFLKQEPSSELEAVPLKKEPAVIDSVEEEAQEKSAENQDETLPSLYCAKCDKHFHARDFHESTHANDASTFRCKFCRKKKFKSRAQFEQHVKECKIISEVDILHDKDGFICPKCFKTFEVKEICIRHVHFHNIKLRQHAIKRLEMNQESTRKQPLQCSECPKKFANQRNLSRHTQMHADLRAGTYKCKTCGQHFSLDLELIDHSLVAHGKFQMAVAAEPGTSQLKVPARTAKFVMPKKDIFRSKASTSVQQREWKVE